MSPSQATPEPLIGALELRPFVTALVSQYEALLRAAWLMYAASEAHLEKLSATLNVQSGAKSKNAKGAEDMLKSCRELKGR
jgi:hypothetical protein